VHSKVLDNDVMLRNLYILDSHRLLLVHSQVPIVMNVAFNFRNFRNFSFCMVHSEILDNEVVLRNFYVLDCSNITSGGILRLL